MSVMNPNEMAGNWRTHKKEPAVHLYLSGARGDAAALVNARVAGFPLSLNLASPGDSIAAESLAGAAAAVIQVDVENSGSVERFEHLARKTSTPLLAAVYDPPLALVRSLIRAGAHDVVPLPLDVSDLETSLMPLREEIVRQKNAVSTAQGKVVSMVKSVGGIGATALLTQLGIRAAQNEAAHGREVCLFDLDVQFGNAAFQLGLQPAMTVFDLLEAGDRLDSELLRALTAVHSSGLRVIAAPPQLMPLDSVNSEQVIEVLDLAKREFGTIFIDLPANWTNWSLSLLAQSDLVLLVAELSVAGLHRARRQLDLMREQDLNALNLQVVVNRFEKRMFRTIRPSDVQDALGRDIAWTIADDQVMRTATEQGVPIAEVKKRSSVGKDIDLLDSGIAGILGWER